MIYVKKLVLSYIAGLCNGSTADFDSVSGSSNLSLAAKVKERKFDFSQNF